MYVNTDVPMLDRPAFQVEVLSLLQHSPGLLTAQVFDALEETNNKSAIRNVNRLSRVLLQMEYQHVFKSILKNKEDV